MAMTNSGTSVSNGKCSRCRHESSGSVYIMRSRLVSTCSHLMIEVLPPTPVVTACSCRLKLASVGQQAKDPRSCWDDSAGIPARKEALRKANMQGDHEWAEEDRMDDCCQ